MKSSGWGRKKNEKEKKTGEERPAQGDECDIGPVIHPRERAKEKNRKKERERKAGWPSATYINSGVLFAALHSLAGGREKGKLSIAMAAAGLFDALSWALLETHAPHTASKGFSLLNCDPGPGSLVN